MKSNRDPENEEEEEEPAEDPPPPPSFREQALPTTIHQWLQTGFGANPIENIPSQQVNREAKIILDAINNFKTTNTIEDDAITDRIRQLEKDVLNSRLSSCFEIDAAGNLYIKDADKIKLKDIIENYRKNYPNDFLDYFNFVTEDQFKLRLLNSNGEVKTNNAMNLQYIDFVLNARKEIIIKSLFDSDNPADRRLSQLVAIHLNKLDEGQINILMRYVALKDKASDKTLLNEVNVLSASLSKSSNELAFQQILALESAIEEKKNRAIISLLKQQLLEFKESIDTVVTDKDYLAQIKTLVNRAEQQVKEIETSKRRQDSKRKSSEITVITQEHYNLLWSIEYKQAILEKRSVKSVLKLDNENLREQLENEVFKKEFEKTDNFKRLKETHDRLQPTLMQKKIDKHFVEDIRNQSNHIFDLLEKCLSNPFFYEIIQDKYKIENAFIGELIYKFESILKEIDERQKNLPLEIDEEQLEKLREDINLNIALLKTAITKPIELKTPPSEGKNKKSALELEKIKQKNKAELDIHFAMIELRQAMIESRVARNTAQIQPNVINENTNISDEIKRKYIELYNAYKARKIDNFDVKKMMGLVGDYQVTRKVYKTGEKPGELVLDKIETETPEQSDQRVFKILGKQGYAVLHHGTTEPESTEKRKLFLHELQKALDKHRKKGDCTKTITMKELLGERGLQLYKEAMEEEAASKAFRNAVFLRSCKSYIGPKWAKRLILWVGGPSSSGKTFATDRMVAKIAKKIMPNRGGEDVENMVVSVDGGVEREVSQIRQLTIQASLELGNIGIDDIEKSKPKAIKHKVLQAAQTNRNLHLAIPETFANKFQNSKIKKILSKFANDTNTLQVFSQVMSGGKPEDDKTFQQSVERMGNSRANVEEGTVYSGITMNNFEIGCESKKYDPGPASIFFKNGISGSNEARLFLRKIQSKFSESHEFHVVNDLVFVVYDLNQKQWRHWKKADKENPSMKNQPVVKMTARAFAAWKLDSESESGDVEALKLWVATEGKGKQSKYWNPILRYYKNGVITDLEHQSQITELSAIEKRVNHTLSLMEGLDKDGKDLAVIKDHSAKLTTLKDQLIKVQNNLFTVSSMDATTSRDDLETKKVEITQQIEASKAILTEALDRGDRLFNVERAKALRTLKDKEEIENIYQQFLLEKALKLEPPRFDIQGHLIVEVSLNLEDLKHILKNAGLSDELLSSLNEARAKAFLREKIGPFTEKTYCTIDIIGNPELQPKFEAWLIGNRKELERPVQALIRSEQRSSINALQKEMEMHMLLSSRVIEQKALEKIIKITPDKWNIIRQSASFDLNQIMLTKFQQALNDSYDKKNNKINIELFNKKLDELRKESASITKQCLLVQMLKNGVSSENIEKILSSIETKDFEIITATGYDYLHTDNRSQSIVRITGTEETAHHKREGADTTATRVLHRKILDRKQVKSYKDQHKEIRVPSLAYKKLKEERGIYDVADKLDHIASVYFNDYPEGQIKPPIIYNLLTSLYGSIRGKRPLDTNDQTLSCDMILNGAHEFNRRQLDKGPNYPFVYVQNIPINRHGSPLDANDDIIKEAKLMSEMAMLQTLAQQKIPGFDEEIQNYLIAVNQLYIQFLSEKQNPHSHFKDSEYGKQAANFLSNIKARINDSFKELDKEINNKISDLSMHELAALALARMFAENKHLDPMYGSTIQTLSVFLEQASLAGCKSANERYQSISGRVDLLCGMDHRGRINYSPTETALRESLEQYAANSDSFGSVEVFRKSLDEAYNEHNLQGAAAAFSEEDQGATSKVQKFIQGAMAPFINWNTNIAESEYLTNQSQNNSGALQAHKGDKQKEFLDIFRNKKNEAIKLAKQAAAEKVAVEKEIIEPSPPLPAVLEPRDLLSAQENKERDAKIATEKKAEVDREAVEKLAKEKEEKEKEAILKSREHEREQIQHQLASEQSSTVPPKEMTHHPISTPMQGDQPPDAQQPAPIKIAKVVCEKIKEGSEVSFNKVYEKDGSLTISCIYPPKTLIEGGMPTWECIQYVKDQIRAITAEFPPPGTIIEVYDPSLIQAYMLICKNPEYGITCINKTSMTDPLLTAPKKLNYKLKLDELDEKKSLLSKLGLFSHDNIEIVLNKIQRRLDSDIKVQNPEVRRKLNADRTKLLNIQKHDGFKVLPIDQQRRVALMIGKIEKYESLYEHKLPSTSNKNAVPVSDDKARRRSIS